MIRNRRTGFTALAAAAALTLAAAPAFAEDEAKQTARVGEPAPQFELIDLEGNTHNLSDYEGQIVVLHWQSLQCPWEVDPSREAARYQMMISGIYRDFASHQTEDGKQRIVFLAINSNYTESADELRSYHTEMDMPYPILKDDGNVVADTYQARTTPHIFIIDETQTLRYKGHPETVPATFSDVGNGEDQYLRDALNALLNGEQIDVTETQSKGCTLKRVRS